MNVAAPTAMVHITLKVVNEIALIALFISYTSTVTHMTLTDMIS